jgi:hypothetical protein
MAVLATTGVESERAAKAEWTVGLMIAGSGAVG